MTATSPSTSSTPIRAAVALAVAAVTAVAVFGMAAGLFGSFTAAMPLAAIAAAAAATLFWRRPIVPMEPPAAPRPLRVISAVATVIALVQLGRLAVFMMVPAQAGYSQFPSSGWERRHSCLTAYFIAARAADTTPNVYDDALSSLPGDSPAVRTPRMLGPFGIDGYEYPPPFLLLPRALGLVISDFVRLRMAWFGINVGVLLTAMIVVARTLPPAAGTRALLFIPLVWIGVPVLNTLQKGNVQTLVISVSMLAMALFARQRTAAGASLLAFASVSKLYPAMLVFYLVLQRQWRAVAWTIGWSIALLLLTLADLGLGPFLAFREHLPGLLSGEALPGFRNPGPMAYNLSIPGLVFKLKLFGVPGMGMPVAQIVGWVYTLIVLAAVAVVARRAVRDEEAPSVWLAILVLATLRSPFLPQGYGAFPAIWLLTLLAARGEATPRKLLLLVLACLALGIYVPTDWGVGPRVVALLNTLPQAGTIGVAFAAIRRSPESAVRAAETDTTAA
jgi:hypothetical protein